MIKKLNNRILLSIAESKPPIHTHLSTLVGEILKLPGWQSIHLRKACKLYFNTKHRKSSVLCKKCLVLLRPVSMERTLLANVSNPSVIFQYREITDH